MWPFIFNFVPNANFDDAAIVLPAVAFVPAAVIPFVLPQHFAQEQYAVILYISPVAPAWTVVLGVVLDSELLDVTVLLTWTILFTGSLITVSDNWIFSISTSFWYLILYVISFIPSLPCCIILFVVFSVVPVVFFVIVSYGIATCSVTIFSVIGA